VRNILEPLSAHSHSYQVGVAAVLCRLVSGKCLFVNSAHLQAVVTVVVLLSLSIQVIVSQVNHHSSFQVLVVSLIIILPYPLQVKQRH